MVQALINNANINNSQKTQYMSNSDTNSNLNKIYKNNTQQDHFEKLLDNLNEKSNQKPNNRINNNKENNLDKHKSNKLDQYKKNSNAKNAEQSTQNNTETVQNKNVSENDKIKESDIEKIDTTLNESLELQDSEETSEETENISNEEEKEDTSNKNLTHIDVNITDFLNNILPTTKLTIDPNATIKQIVVKNTVDNNADNTDSQILNNVLDNEESGKLKLSIESTVDLEELKVEIPIEDMQISTTEEDIIEDKDNNQDLLEEDLLKDLEIKAINIDNESSTASNDENPMQEQSPQEAGIKAMLNTENNSFSEIKNEIKVESTQNLQKNNNINTNPSKIIEQISKQMEGLQNHSKVSIVLNPESLGKVSIQLINTKDGLSAQFTVANQEARDLIMKGLDSLKDNLLTHGINVDNVSVKLDNNIPDKNNSNWTEQEGSRGGNKEQRQQKQEKNKEEFEQAMSFIKKENGKV